MRSTCIGIIYLNLYREILVYILYFAVYEYTITKTV